MNTIGCRRGHAGAQMGRRFECSSGMTSEIVAAVVEELLVVAAVVFGERIVEVGVESTVELEL